MTDDILNIINTISYALGSIVALVALIAGFIFVNKRLRVYVYVNKGNRLVIQVFERGNGVCKIDNAVFWICEKSDALEASISDNSDRATIDLSIIDSSCKKIWVEIIDNFGRRYKHGYRIKR